MIKIQQAHEDFIEHLGSQGKSSATLIAYSKDIEQLMDHLAKEGIDLVSQVELHHLEEFMQKLTKENYTPKSVSRKTNATKTFFKYLHSLGHIKENIADYLKHPKVDLKAPRILSRLEYRALRDATRDDARSYAMVEVLLQTGITISELADLKTEDLKIEGETGNLFIPKKNNRDSRNIPLNKAVVEAVNKYMETDRPKLDNAKHLFITKTGKPLLVRNIRSTVNRYFKLAGVENAKVNDLRHTFVAHHLAAGVSIIHISKIAGHKRISTTERYLEYIEKVTTEEKTELGVL
ncbi:tyrosine-type recombinase/integrase [candidate division WWE3 bacterium]|uniref:Tyrosine-type recombinase/integrase n=1 Tax=candidate division WWE3 bacterium TaxID=2053526 RepID=A0A7X9DL04_UNCKA|nr:tyrosine-type recombinase/integrase [candidate division WWE3 bacterium]